MSGVNRAAVVVVGGLALAAAFALGRWTAPVERDAAPEDLAVAIEAAIGEPDVLDRSERLAHLLHYMGPDNVTAVAEVYDRMLNILGEISLRPFIAAWGRFDPQAALQHALDWPYQDKRELGAGAAIEAWALQDPAAALEAYERISKRSPALADTLLFDLLTGWVYSGEPGLDDFVANLNPGILDTAISRVAAKILRHGGAEALLHWADEIFENDTYASKFKRKVFQRTTRMVARWEPERAAAWSLEYRDRDYASDGPRIVAEQWGMQDGRAALAWVRNHPDQELQHQAAREGFRTWYEAHPADAVAWLESEQLTEFHDPIVMLYAKELAYREPAEAVGWCERILDGESRLGCLKKTASLWHQRDAEAAEAWLQDSPLDEQAREFVRTPPKNKRLMKGRPRQKPPGAMTDEP